MAQYGKVKKVVCQIDRDCSFSNVHKQPHIVLHFLFFFSSR